MGVKRRGGEATRMRLGLKAVVGERLGRTHAPPRSVYLQGTGVDGMQRARAFPPIATSPP